MDWKESIAEEMASMDGIVLTDNHWEVNNFLRNYSKVRDSGFHSHANRFHAAKVGVEFKGH